MVANEFRLKNGSLFLVVESAGGIYNSTQLQCIAKVCDERAVVAKLTEDQRVSIVIQENEIPDVAKTLSEAGMGLRHYQDGLHQATSCIGGLCPFSCQDALEASVKLSDVLSQLETLSPLKIGINGCPRSCVPTHTLDISLIGDEAGYKLYLGGRNRQLPELATFIAEDIPKDLVPEYIVKVIELYKEKISENETFGELIERIGMSPFAKLLEPYSQNAFGEIMGDPMASEPSEFEKMPLAELDESIVDENSTVMAEDSAKASPDASSEEKLTDYIEEVEEFADDDSEFDDTSTEQSEAQRQTGRSFPERSFDEEKASMSNVSASSGNEQRKLWEFSNVSLENKNEVLLSFTSGATILLKIDHKTPYGKRTLGFGATAINVTWSPHKLIIESGELTITLPRSAAA